MKHIAIFAMSVTLLAFSSQAADTPSGSTNAPAATNALHFSSKFAERLHQIREHQVTNQIPDRASQQAMIEKQMQQLEREHEEALKCAAPLLPPTPPKPQI
jgi:C-terminal processing protease CtpA/Prc